MDLRQTKNIKERFRTVKGQLYRFPADESVEDYSLVGYLQGNNIDMTKGLDLSCFDMVEYLKESNNIKNKGKFVHALGYRECDNTFTVLILKKKK